MKMRPEFKTRAVDTNKHWSLNDFSNIEKELKYGIDQFVHSITIPKKYQNIWQGWTYIYVSLFMFEVRVSAIGKLSDCLKFKLKKKEVKEEN